MPLGGATKKLQKLLDTAEDLYHRVNELREEIEVLRETVRATNEAVDRLETDLDYQRALLEALAREEGIDVDRVLAETAIEDAETREDPTGEDPAAAGEDPAAAGEDPAHAGEDPPGSDSASDTDGNTGPGRE